MTPVPVASSEPDVMSPGAGLSPITVRVAESVDGIPSGDWGQICAEHDEALMDLRFLKAAERSAEAESHFWYLTFYDAANEPVGAACLSQFTLDGTLFAQPWARWVVLQIRRLIPRYLKFRVVLCGLPVSTGGSHLRIVPGAPAAAIVAMLGHELARISRQQRAWLIVAKEFDPEECGLADHLVPLGYLRADSLPMNVFRHRFDNFDALLAAMRKRYRSQVNRSRKKFAAAGVRVEHITDPAAMLELYTPEVHRLYQAVVERAEHKLEILPREFFLQLVREFGEQMSLTAVRQGERIVAFAWGLKTGEVYRSLFAGMDYTLNEEADLYFNLLANDLDYGLRRHATEILVGQTADTFKSRLGCQVEPRFIYVRCTVGWLHWCMKATATWLFPKPPPPPERDLLKTSGSDDRAEAAAES